MAKIYSSVNTRVTTIKNCEEEPIHIPGSIQPHGFLFVINKQTGNIDLCSANTDSFLAEAPAYFLSKSYSDILPKEFIEIIASGDFVSSNDTDKSLPETVNFNGHVFDCFKHVTDSYILLECIVAVDSPYHSYALFSTTNDLLRSADGKTTLYGLCTIVAEKIRGTIGFDRVMVYRYDGEYNGRVYAESAGENVESFLGLHYPHTDIPKQARDLYVKNPLRLIQDVHYDPVPIVTLDPGLARPELIDLSAVRIRSVSPIHITYLKNLKVGASMSISIIRQGKLWGLIACHHSISKPLPYTLQIQAYLLTQVLSSQIDVHETAENYALALSLDIPLKKLMDYLKRQENFIELHFEKSEEVRNIVNASGAALIHNDKIYTNGIVPPLNFISNLKTWLDEKGVEDYHTDRLSQELPASIEYADISSGILYKLLNKESNTALFWFRQSSDEVIFWAGRPGIQQKEEKLTPRNSFEAWKEIKKGISAGWELPELDAAFRFSYLLQQHMLNIFQYENDLKNRKLNEQLAKANKELENINWISTHDLKEPLRKIQVFASMMDTTKNLPTVDTMNRSIEKIKSAALKMQQFIDDLLIYSKMSGTEMRYEPVDLNTLIAGIEADFLEEKEQHVFALHAVNLPVINASKFQMQQLFVNLIDNAIKFKKEDQRQIININYEQTNEPASLSKDKSRWHKITVSDSGIGFSKDVFASIFDIFRKGHSDIKYKGTGVGLSVCRKIMENHGGKIAASGVKGEGAVFTLYFPVS
jgi:light-regulated signal transduction histidine kinase (bacteriophytochrome)